MENEKMENETMNITSATFAVPDEGEQPIAIQAVIDGQQMSVPMDPANRHYKEILRQTKAKTLVIENPS
jgi:hypothetical protein